MTMRQETGKAGEDIAVNFIKNLGYKVVERNYRRKWGEIDIISIAPDKTLVFFEVKALYCQSNMKETFNPEDQMTNNKLKRVQKTAIFYVNSNPRLVNNDRGWRIDLLAIDIIKETGSLNVRHYENV